MDFFEQSVADSVVFIEHVKRYGVAGVVEALQNYVNQLRPSDDKCSNGCRVEFNVACELGKCAKAIRGWYWDALETD